MDKLIKDIIEMLESGNVGPREKRFSLLRQCYDYERTLETQKEEFSLAVKKDLEKIMEIKTVIAILVRLIPEKNYSDTTKMKVNELVTFLNETKQDHEEQLNNLSNS